VGLFDKKFCDICGEKIGLLGNRKLADGNLCKNCAAKLSPFMTDRRQSTLEEIKAHLAYREQNQKNLASFHPTRIIGGRTKVCIDEAAGKFIVTTYTNWQNENPDLIDLSQVVRCSTDIREHKQEIYRQLEGGKRESYDPPRYECEYEFAVEIQVNSPYFSEINFELSTMRPDSPYTDLYRDCERQAHELTEALMRRPTAAAPAPAAAAASAPAAAAAAGSWTCACGAVNTGKFCESCGQARPAESRGYRCNKCGWQPAPGAQPPRFCPQCGDPFDENDID